jgi:hypothetical protein
MVDKALVLKTEEESWSSRGRCTTLELKEATRSFVMVLPLRTCLSSGSAIKDASYSARISNPAATNSVPQLSVSSLSTAATTKEQQCIEF